MVKNFSYSLIIGSVLVFSAAVVNISFIGPAMATHEKKAGGPMGTPKETGEGTTGSGGGVETGPGVGVPGAQGPGAGAREPDIDRPGAVSGGHGGETRRGTTEDESSIGRHGFKGSSGGDTSGGTTGGGSSGGTSGGAGGGGGR